MVPRPRSPAGAASGVSPRERARMGRASAGGGPACWARAAGVVIATAPRATAPIRPPSEARVRSRILLTMSAGPPVSAPATGQSLGRDRRQLAGLAGGDPADHQGGRVALLE